MSVGPGARVAALAVVAAAAATTLLAAPPAITGPARGAAATPAPAAGGLATATFAGGCFWCLEPPFDALPGVVSTTAGYTGGRTADPTYEEVSAGATGHAEAVQVRYDPQRVGYAALLQVFWHNVDPLAVDRQFCDVGRQYRTAIFVHDDAQRRLAEESKRALESSGRFAQPLATEIVPASTFHPAEAYHQDYYRKNPLHYRFYRYNCGRDRRLKEVWGDEAPHADEPGAGAATN